MFSTEIFTRIRSVILLWCLNNNYKEHKLAHVIYIATNIIPIQYTIILIFGSLVRDSMNNSPYLCDVFISEKVGKKYIIKPTYVLH